MRPHTLNAAYVRHIYGATSGTIFDMNIVLLGVGIGLLSLLPPGPVNLTLVQVGARMGRRPALQGAAGIVGGDSVLGFVSVALLALGTALPANVFSATQVAAASLLIVLGALLALRPAAISNSIDRMQRPRRAFFLLTSLTPTALGSWVAMLAAMPFAADTTRLALFTVGVLVASSLWHPTLGVTAAALGGRLTDRGQIRLSQLGGGGMAILGIGLLLQQVS